MAKRKIIGTTGDDYLHALDDTRAIIGGEGDDIIVGNAGDNVLRGGTGEDQLLAGKGKDKLYGGDDADEARGGAGKDKLFGGEGDDTLYGNGGADVLKGEAGNDTLDGGAGADRLNGGADADTLTGGGGSDVFVFNGVEADGDFVTDFVQGADTFDFPSIAGGSFLGSDPFSAGGAFELRATDDGTNTFIEADFDGDGGVDATVTVAGVHTLTADDFTF